MVHEGEAVSGHYWSYVYNREANTWLKFNDISVTEASWQEVVKESEGGYGTASAYCLIYTQSTDNQEKPREGAVLLTGKKSIHVKCCHDDVASSYKTPLQKVALH